MQSCFYFCEEILCDGLLIYSVLEFSNFSGCYFPVSWEYCDGKCLVWEYWCLLHSFSKVFLLNKHHTLPFNLVIKYSPLYLKGAPFKVHFFSCYGMMGTHQFKNCHGVGIPWLSKNYWDKTVSLWFVARWATKWWEHHLWSLLQPLSCTIVQKQSQAINKQMNMMVFQ